MYTKFTTCKAHIKAKCHHAPWPKPNNRTTAFSVYVQNSQS